MATDLELRREAEIIRLIKLFNGMNFIVVGGYAIDAYTAHRFSIDLDIVVRGTGLKSFEDIIKKEGYELSVVKKDFDLTYSGEFKQYFRGEVSIDFLINSLVSRTTGASWSFETIIENSDKRLVKGRMESVEAIVPVKELLVSMKLHSGRITDIRDIVMLSDGLDIEKVIPLSNRGDIKILLGILTKYDEMLKSKNFTDSLRGVFSLSSKKRGYNIAVPINKTRRMLEFLRKNL